MLTLVRRARRRLLINDLLAQGVSATTAALVAFIGLLLVGTEVLRWFWLVIPVSAAVFGIARAWRRRPSLYTTAQMVDRRLHFEDTLSTAFYFTSGGQRRSDEEICRLQRERADRLAALADIRAAAPFTMPRSIYAMAALMLVASSLFALRYGLHRRLDLRPPIAHMFQHAFGFEQKTEQARNVQKEQPPPELQQGEDENGVERDRQAGGREGQEGVNVADDPNQSQAGKPEAQKAGEGQKQGQPGEQAESGEKDGAGQERDGKDGESSGAGQQQGKQGQKQDGGKQDTGTSGENSSLMSKVKDAMQNLLSRMKPQQGQQGQQQSSMDQKGSQSKGQQNASKQQASKDGQQQAGSQQSDSEDGQASEQAQNGQDSQGKGTGKSDSAQQGKQPGSGIGSQDGDKNIRQAEQLAAMGKISEILGKRSANVTGESSVEVQSTSQQLRTPYAQRGVRHLQSGVEINRDEVPLALQGFVAQYFEQVRKQPAAKK